MDVLFYLTGGCRLLELILGIGHRASGTPLLGGLGVGGIGHWALGRSKIQIQNPKSLSGAIASLGGNKSADSRAFACKIKQVVVESKKARRSSLKENACSNFNIECRNFLRFPHLQHLGIAVYDSSLAICNAAFRELECLRARCMVGRLRPSPGPRSAGVPPAQGRQGSFRSAPTPHKTHDKKYKS